MKQLDDLSATATAQVHPEVLGLHEEHGEVSLQTINQLWTQCRGNVRKVRILLELGRSNPARLMTPGQHHNMALDRPQGGSASFSAIHIDASSVENPAPARNVPLRQNRIPSRLRHALGATRTRVLDKLDAGLLGDTSRIFALAGTDYEDMMANNS